MEEQATVQKNNPAWVVKSVKPREDYTLELEFNDGSRRIFDATSYIKRPIMAKLQDLKTFMKAHIVGPSVGWDEETDIAPEILYEKSKII